MRRVAIILGLLALAIPASAVAVDLHPDHVGTSCPDGGTFHFVANGVAGKVGSLTVAFDGVQSVIGVSTKYNQGTNHWTIDGTGTLTGAWATEGTKLVLSDFTCAHKKDGK